jgi:hypothetical protein
MKRRKVHKIKAFYYLDHGVKIIVKNPTKAEKVLGFKLSKVKFIKEADK